MWTRVPMPTRASCGGRNFYLLATNSLWACINTIRSKRALACKQTEIHIFKLKTFSRGVIYIENVIFLNFKKEIYILEPSIEHFWEKSIFLFNCLRKSCISCILYVCRWSLLKTKEKKKTEKMHLF